MHYPERREMKDAMDVGKNSIEGAKYFNQCVKKKYAKAPISDVEKEALFNKADEYTDLVESRLAPSTEAWSGEPPPESNFKNMQRNIAKKAAQSLNGEINGVLRVDFAINKQSKHARAYSIDRNPVPPKVESSLDKLYNSCLAEEDIICQKEELYQSNANGDIKKDAKGDLIKADPEQTKEFITDEERGLKTFLIDQNIDGLEDVVVYAQDYEESVAEKEKAPVKEEMVEAVLEEKEEARADNVPSQKM